MKRLTMRLIFALALILFISAPAGAKWWIFGASEEEVAINYLYLNQMSYEEAGKSIKLFRETLPEGMINIRGKATVRKGAIGSVLVSIDDKANWERARLSQDGTFMFSFKPEAARVYTLYVRVIDTRGKTNDVEATRKEVVLDDRNITAAVKEAMDKLVDAYKNKDAGRFMSGVGEDFAGDATNLDRAIRRDFSSLSDIQLSYTLNNVAADAKGKIYISLNYSRMAIPLRGKGTLSDRGATEFSFSPGDPGLKLFSMKFPLIFGLSDAANVATGMVRMTGNEAIIIITPGGTVEKLPFDKALKSMEEGSASIASDSLTSTPTTIFESFALADGDKTTENWNNACNGNISGDFGVYGTNHHVSVRTGVTVADVGIKSLEDVKAAPPGGYVNPHTSCGWPIGSGNPPPPGSTFRFQQGRSYVFKLPGSAYGAIEVTGFSGNRVNFKYKYTASGPNF